MQLWAEANDNPSNSKENLLKYVIILDSLLLSGPGEGNRHLSQRTALLLATKSEDRKVINEITKDIYNERNKLIHHGKTDIDIFLYYQAQTLSQATINTMIEKLSKLKSTKEWTDYLDNKIFA